MCDLIFVRKSSGLRNLLCNITGGSPISAFCIAGVIVLLVFSVSGSLYSGVVDGRSVLLSSMF